MKIYAQIPTPKNCIECQFKNVRVGAGYGKCKVQCAIQPNILIEVTDAQKGRAENCPGIIEEES